MICEHKVSGLMCPFCELLDKQKQEIERLKRIEAAARKWYQVQQGTMAALGPSGLAMKAALEM
jgi:hypothetical protein